MKTPYRASAARILTLLAILLVLGLPVASPTLAQTVDEEPAPTEPSEPAGESVAPQPDQSDEQLTRRERKDRAKEQRIQEYLRRKEERREKKEMERESRAAQEAGEDARRIESEQLAAQRRAIEQARQAAAAETQTVTEVDAPAETKKKKRGGPGSSKPVRLPRGLARAQANVRANVISLDPTVQDYLNLIDESGASPQQLAAFGNFVAQNGMLNDALEYYDVAVRLEPKDPVMLVNLGTLQLQKGAVSDAASTFSRVLSMDPNNAVAHYNLGAAFDRMNKYEDAVFEYKAALTLDPSLGDPSVNPQVANNDLMLAVRLMLYQEQAGSLSVPLLDVMTGDLETVADREGE